MVGLDDVRVDQIGDELGLADEILDEHLLARVIERMILMATRLTKLRAPFCSASYTIPCRLKDFADDFVVKLALNCEERHGRMV